MENRVNSLQGKGEIKFPGMGRYFREYFEGPEPPAVQFLGGSECFDIPGIKPYQLSRSKGRDRNASGNSCRCILLNSNSDFFPEVVMELGK